MENKKGKQGVYSVEQRRLVPHEEISDSMTIKKKGFRRVWRPNNYRRQIKVKIKSDSTAQEIKGTMGTFPVEISKKKIITIKNYMGVTLQYGRETLTAIYSQKIINGEKEVFVFEASCVDILSRAVKEKKDEIMHLIDEALFSFARKFNLVLPLEKPIWSRHEDWTVDEEIKKIPEWTIVHGEHMKKVYPEGVEFTGGKGDEPVSKLLNRIRNTALKDASPVIVDELLNIEKMLNPLGFLMNNVFDVDDVFDNKDVVNMLSAEQRFNFETWLIHTFGVGDSNA